MNTFKKTALSATLLALTGAASAGIVTNDTELLSGAGHQQLSTWLGEDVDLTRIFAKGIDGSTAQDWHAKVDGRGRTFSLVEIFSTTNNERRIIGGYNQVSWDSTSGHIESTSRQNFLFNLTHSTLYRKNNSYNYQTYNNPTNGPTFGGGHDLLLNESLSGGRTNIGFSYGDNARWTQESYLAEFGGSDRDWTVGKLETFTLSAPSDTFGSGAKAMTDEQGNAVAAANVSAPIGLGMLSLSLLAFGARRRT
jgi:hypothetical protein